MRYMEVNEKITMVKYSFIVPVYGCEKYLEKCVNSILAQTGSHEFEVILVDDGSKDRSGQIADGLAQQDSRIRVFHKENGGAASARNFGLQAAKGDYIIFVDGDDTVENQLLQSVDDILNKNPDSLIIFGMSFDYYHGDVCERSQILSCNHEGGFTVQRLLSEYKNFFYDNAISSACNKVFSMKIIRENCLQMRAGMTLYEDYDFVLRYLACVEEVICLPQPFYHYRNDLDAQHLGKRVAVLDKLQDNMKLLFQSVLELSSDSVQLFEVSANLYMVLLWQHLKVHTYTADELERHTVNYCAEPGFHEMLKPGVQMGDFERELFQKIESREFYKLFWEIKIKKIIASLKSGVKRILSAVGVNRF